MVCVCGMCISGWVGGCSLMFVVCVGCVYMCGDGLTCDVCVRACTCAMH